jgi:glycosyltransferase involved in cell wall biosynthesis
MVLLEAMAANLPIIATAVDGVPQVMSDCGFLVPPGSVDEMAEMIRTCCRQSPQERLARGKLARQRLENKYTTAHFRQVFWNIFSKRGLTP